jgi:protocatechuate 3,4-dioxygenase beta subunit
VLSGRVLDEDERPLPGTLVEIWQANAAGRYLHDVDQHDAPRRRLRTGASARPASTMERNLLGDDEQWARLRLVAETPRRIWG